MIQVIKYVEKSQKLIQNLGEKIHILKTIIFGWTCYGKILCEKSSDHNHSIASMKRLEIFDAKKWDD